MHQAIHCSIFVAVTAKDRRKNKTIAYKKEAGEVNQVNHSGVFFGYKR